LDIFIEKWSRKWTKTANEQSNRGKSAKNGKGNAVCPTGNNVGQTASPLPNPALKKKIQGIKFLFIK
jgi:hypothetical protein